MYSFNNFSVFKAMCRSKSLPSTQTFLHSIQFFFKFYYLRSFNCSRLDATDSLCMLKVLIFVCIFSQNTQDCKANINLGMCSLRKGAFLKLWNFWCVCRIFMLFFRTCFWKLPRNSAMYTHVYVNSFQLKDGFSQDGQCLELLMCM